MVPETAGALIAFLGLVAPGVVFWLVRERYRPPRTMTTFREAGIVALTSLVFTVVAALLLLLLAATWLGGWLPDLGAWVTRGDAYLDDHVATGLGGLAAHVALACTLAAATARLLARSGSAREIRGTSMWFQVFREDRPDGAKPWTRAELDDECQVWGFLGHYTLDDTIDKQEITLIGPRFAIQRKDEERKVLDGDWACVLFPATRIRRLMVTYIDDADGSIRPARQHGSENREPADAGHGDEPSRRPRGDPSGPLSDTGNNRGAHDPQDRP